MRQDSPLARFSRRLPFPVRLAVTALLALGLLQAGFAALPYGGLLFRGLKAPARQCSLWQIMRSYGPGAELKELVQQLTDGSRLVERDEALGLVRVAGEGWSYWAPEGGAGLPPRKLVPYLEAEHLWMARHNPAEFVQPGDTVVDCGAHIGIFTAHALQRGASRVIAIEPDASNLECLRRNVAEGIASGRVTVVPMAVWNEETTLEFTISDSSSARHSAIIKTGNRTVRVAAARLDTILRQHGAGRVGYLKMDIEGAERQAVEGARGMLAHSRPRVMLESYPLPDDPAVLPAILRAAHPGYREICGPCEWSTINRHWTPHVLYFR